MARNQSTLPNPLGHHFDDWFELYNPNDGPVDLSGYTLTDDLSRPTQWTVPPATTIPAHGFLLIWADNEPGGTGPDTGFHTNFKLNQDGEAIGLFAPDGTQVDAVTFGPQAPDVSEGRFPDGVAASFVPMHSPTPGAPNVFDSSQPRATSLTLSANGLVITWSVQAGKTYQMQFKDNLNEPQWRTFGDSQTPTAPTLSLTDNSALNARQRFYRLLLVP